MKTPILGSNYVTRSINAADNRMINLFPESVPQGGKEPAFLNRAPGLKFQRVIGNGPIRGLWVHRLNSTDFYTVSGNEVYRSSGLNVSPILIGNVSGTGPVSISDNGPQIFFACNGPSYIYNQNTNVFQQITDPDFPGAVTVGFIDGYFVFNEPNSQRFWVTSLINGLSVDPLAFASAEGATDGLVALGVNNREIWLFGSESTEVWYDAGTPDFPLQPIQGAFNEIGCAAAYSVAKLDNSLFWLGQDARGQGMVYRATGYIGKRISDHSSEFAISNVANISDAIAYTYQQGGHSFYVLTFPSGNLTLVYDVATNEWCQRAGFDNGSFTRHRSNCQCNFRGDIIVGDYQNGNIYTLDLNVYSDNNGIQKWLRSWRALGPGQNNLKRSAHHNLQIDCQTGVGINIGQGSDPQLMLRWSDDGGHTWSNEHLIPMGKIGQYGFRALIRRLGMTDKLRDRVYEASGTDPTIAAIMGAELFATSTNA